MPDKILMNKNTLAALKTELKEYREALPIFEMKEQQLAGEVRQIEADIARLEAAMTEAEARIRKWVGVLAEPIPSLKKWVSIDRVDTSRKEIAGVTVDTFDDITFVPATIDPVSTPLWVDAAVEAIRDQRTNRTIAAVQQAALMQLEEALAEARRMKNALKEVFIPETLENIRRIEIYLGDVERLAIGCAKLVKKKKNAKAKVL